MQFRPRVMRDGECAQGPVGIAPVTRRHVLGHGGMPAIAAGAAAIRSLLEKIWTARGASSTSTLLPTKR
jgi:hypothetical protein